LRSLEEEGLVTSEWQPDLPGPAKRTYTLTPEGHAVLASWLAAVEQLRDGLTMFLDRAEEGGDHVRTTPPASVE
jgi:DNA-binding PadR family transcriptional regulator